jgi:hypothetical protein
MGASAGTSRIVLACVEPTDAVAVGNVFGLKYWLSGVDGRNVCAVGKIEVPADTEVTEWASLEFIGSQACLDSPTNP